VASFEFSENKFCYKSWKQGANAEAGRVIP
jgi:hypothetical protein